MEFFFEVFGPSGPPVSRLIHDDIDLGHGKAGQLDLDMNVEKALELNSQKLLVPAGIQRELIVSEDVSSPLRRVQMGEAQGRNRLHFEKLRRLNTAVTGDDFALIGDEHGVIETESLDRRSDLFDLRLAVTPGVSAKAKQPRTPPFRALFRLCTSRRAFFHRPRRYQARLGRADLHVVARQFRPV